MSFRYYIGSTLQQTLKPILYFQAKQIRATLPKLPAAEGASGMAIKGAGRRIRLLTIGESTIAGVGVNTHEEGFTGSLARGIGEGLDVDVEWKVYAKSGSTAEDVANNLIPQIEEIDADLIVVGVGGNDTFRMNRRSRWQRSIRDIVTRLRSRFPSSPIVFTNMPPVREFPAFPGLVKFALGNHADFLGDALEKMVTAMENVFFYSRKLNLEDWIHRLGVDADPSDFFSDGVHPSKLTYQVWGKDMSGFIADQRQIVDAISPVNIPQITPDSH